MGRAAMRRMTRIRAARPVEDAGYMARAGGACRVAFSPQRGAAAHASEPLSARGAGA